MKKHSIIFLAFLSFISCTEPQERSITSFNEDWNFYKGDVEQGENTDFDDSDWRVLNVPRDWVIEGPFDKSFDARCGGLPFFGTAWYRKHFTANDSLRGKIVTVDFYGVMNNATVYLNRHKIRATLEGLSFEKVTITSKYLDKI